MSLSIAAGKELLPKLALATTGLETRIKQTEDVADFGRSFSRPEPTAEEIALAEEFRTVLRGMSLTERRDKYRQLVMASDPRARWAESDPVSALADDHSREWARKWRISHSEFTEQLTVLTATLRSYALLLEAARRAF